MPCCNKDWLKSLSGKLYHYHHLLLVFYFYPPSRPLYSSSFSLSLKWTKLDFKIIVVWIMFWAYPYCSLSVIQRHHPSCSSSLLGTNTHQMRIQKISHLFTLCFVLLWIKVITRMYFPFSHNQIMKSFILSLYYSNGFICWKERNDILNVSRLFTLFVWIQKSKLFSSFL